MNELATTHPLILCVEDEDTLRRDIAEELVEAGYRVIEAADGRDALTQLEAVRPDLILCDICMPDMDGYDLLRATQERPDDYAGIPFLFMSALADGRDVVKGKLRGADDYLTKPIDFDLLLATVQARLRQIRRMKTHPMPAGDKVERQLAVLSGTDISPSSGYEAVLDLISTAIVLIDSHGVPVFLNRAACEMKDSCIELSSALSNCIGVTPAKQGFAAWVATTLQQGDEDNVSTFTMHCHTGDEDFRMVGCRLGSDGEEGPQLALFIAKASKSAMLATGILSEMFGFTVTESLIAVELARGQRPVDIAASLDIAQTTVAFHMRNIFQKTGVNRQAQLVALLLTSPASIL
ncbi:response regulator [Sphingopyxis flava]|uniref:Regulatory protein, luxR family n=1 Tax=Sphingopyxis flava TaxID=1507287 RepID=A0A1T5FBL9_9SPHN|nr:response regulator [Sphingopyxis flava]SKB93534.1 regulatory protein, luxR family [Sphingopyxis flava]